MRTLEYLYCKYYAFQVRIGHGDIAPFSAMLIIVFSTILYIISLFMLLNFIFGIHIPKVNAEAYVMAFFLMIMIFYFLLVHKGKYKEVLKRSGAKNKSNLGAILFPLIAFVLFNIGLVFKMLQNQGRF